MNKAILACSFLVAGAVSVNAQTVNKIGSNPMTIGSNSVLELESTTKGFLAPRMTNSQRNAFTPNATTDAGMFIFQTDANAGVAALGATAAPAEPIGFYQWSGTRWVNQTNANSTTASNIRVGVAYAPTVGAPYVAAQEMTLTGDGVAIDPVLKTVSISSSTSAIATLTAATTLNQTNSSVYVSGTTTLTLPTTAAYTGKTYQINKTDSNVLTFSSNITYSDGTTFTTVNYPKSFRIQFNGTNWYIL